MPFVIGAVTFIPYVEFVNVWVLAFFEPFYSNFVFPEKAPQALFSYQYLRNIVKGIAVRAGAPQFHAHSARHYCATALLRAGVDIRRVQTYLGHRSLRSTQRYTHLSNSEVAKDMKIKLEELFREVKGLNKNVQKVPQPIHILSGAGRSRIFWYKSGVACPC